MYTEAEKALRTFFRSDLHIKGEFALLIRKAITNARAGRDVNFVMNGNAYLVKVTLAGVELEDIYLDEPVYHFSINEFAEALDEFFASAAPEY